MPSLPIGSSSAVCFPRGPKLRSWAMTGASVAALGCLGAIAAAAVVTPAPGFLFASMSAPSAPVMALGAKPSSGPARVLTGVNGEAFAQATADAGGEDQILPASRHGMITPAALDRLSAGDCMTLTTTSGQKLSFRIVGARQGDAASKRAEGASLELAVTACAPGGEDIAKAVIESQTDAPGKQPAVQRNL